MKISVHSSDGTRIVIPVPNFLILSPTIINFALKIGTKYSGAATPSIPQETVTAFCKSIKAWKKQHDTWELIHAESASGDIVSITI